MPGNTGRCNVMRPDGVERSRSVDEHSKESYQVVVMGAAKVGKSAIVSQFLYDKYLPLYKETVEDMHSAEYNIGGNILALSVLDTSGSLIFPAMRELSMKNADGFILVFAVDDVGSFEEVRAIREEILVKRKKPVPIVVVGNKTDISDRKVHRIQAETVVTMDWEHGYVETSARHNENIIEVFKELLRQSKIQYALSPAVRRRRQSLPSYTHKERVRDPGTKRHSCEIS